MAAKRIEEIKVSRRTIKVSDTFFDAMICFEEDSG